MGKKILIIRDDLATRRDLENLLEKHRYEVAVTEDFANAAEFALSMNAHLVLLDLNLSINDGHRVCREIRRQSRVPIIVAACGGSEADELVSLNLGADHFVAKPYNAQILLARIESLLNRAYPDEQLLEYSGLTLDQGTGKARFGSAVAVLTKNELRILSILMENQGKIVTRAEITHALWQTESYIDDNTLTVNINRLRKRLESIGAKDAVKTRRGLGYCI